LSGNLGKAGFKMRARTLSAIIVLLPVVSVQECQGESRLDFLRRHGATQTILYAIDSNPFRYQSQIVAVPARFLRMVSATTALFVSVSPIGGPPRTLFVSKMPTNEFKGGEEVNLAIKVIGISNEFKVPH